MRNDEDFWEPTWGFNGWFWGQSSQDSSRLQKRTVLPCWFLSLKINKIPCVQQASNFNFLTEIRASDKERLWVRDPKNWPWSWPPSGPPELIKVFGTSYYLLVLPERVNYHSYGKWANQLEKWAIFSSKLLVYQGVGPVVNDCKWGKPKIPKTGDLLTRVMKTTSQVFNIQDIDGTWWHAYGDILEVW